MMEQFASLQPFKNKDELQRVIQLAAEDQHTVINPTDVVMKNGQIAGYLSIANTPIVIGHFSTRIMRARDSFNLIHVAEHVVRRSTGAANVVWPIGESSPFYKFFPEMGYKELAVEPVKLFIKEF